LSGDGFLTQDGRVAPGGVVAVANASDETRHVKIERLVYPRGALTAHALSMLEEFRSQFSSELVKRSTPLKVTRVAILFSDLTNSTALYTSAGDAAAFRLVDDHFDVLRPAIEAHEGIVVKTMGDAVMAAFADEERCIRSALAALESFATFRKTARLGEHVDLKLGICAGPAYVVTANSRLDYFGQTVNLASRIQHLANAGELVVEARHAPEVAAFFGSRPYETEMFEARVKGVDTALRLLRVRIPPSA
jgi:adenylate cyclase